MAIYWHPLLAQFLRHDYGDRLVIEAEVPLGEMPLRADLVLIRQRPAAQEPLPYPFNHLGWQTLVEYKGPEEAAQEADLQVLEIYGLLYQLREGISARADLTLWLVASRFAAKVSNPAGAYIEGLREVGPGVRGGVLDRFPTFLVELDRLPLNEDTLPLLMVYKGPREREVVEYAWEHREKNPYYFLYVHFMHQDILQEVLAMRGMSLEELELTPQTLINAMGEEGVIRLLDEMKIIQTLGEERILRTIGEERILRTIGEERILRTIGEEKVLSNLIRLLGKERVREMLERIPEA